MPQGKMDKRTIESIVQSAVKDAIDFVDEEISEDRTKAQRYFDGKVDIGEEDGRSKVVATKVRDTVRAIKPSLMRVFLSTDNFVEYVPKGPEDVSAAEQATKYAHYALNEIGGYRLLNDAFHDALVKKTGIVKVYWEDYSESEVYDLNNLSEEEYYMIASQDNVEILEYSEEQNTYDDPTGMVVNPTEYSLKVNVTKTDGKLCADSVPPEEFLIDRNARSLEDAYVVAHQTEMRVGDIVAMGYDEEEVTQYAGVGSTNTQLNEEDTARRGYEHQDEDESADPSMRLVQITEAYMRIDVYGTGQAQMHKMTLLGGNYHLLDHEPWGELPFAVFEVDPEPHTFFGRSIADLIMNDQDASTAMLRGVLDNVALVNSPRTEFVEGQVNVDDLMNNEIGGLVRTRAPGMVRDLTVPYVAGQTLSAIQYMDDAVEQKTGVTKASMGLDPDAMQSTTKAAVNATMSAAAGQVEVIARNLAEGGMRQLFKLILKLINENTDEEQMMRLNGQYIPVDPASWNTSMDVSVNVGLGTGREEEKLMTLQNTLQFQMGLWQTAGPNNGLVSLTNIRNTAADILALSGIRNTDRHYKEMNPEIEQQIMQQMAQAQQGQQGDPQAEAFLQAEQIKAQQKSQSDQMKMQIEAHKAIANDDLQRDKMDQDLMIKQAQMQAEYDSRINIERLKQMQNEPREAPRGQQQQQGNNF